MAGRALIYLLNKVEKKIILPNSTGKEADQTKKAD